MSVCFPRWRPVTEIKLIFEKLKQRGSSYEAVKRTDRGKWRQCSSHDAAPNTQSCG
nr:MAG TPA: hypothetical protein [Caudoviricetes sp.]